MLPYEPTIVAEALLSVLDEAAVLNDRATLAIPGGRSPGAVLTALARLCDARLRERLHLLWLDERAVPAGHADRNDAAGLAAWAAGGALPGHIHPMPAEAGNLDAAAEVYAHTLFEATGGGALDACLIGIGEDGHLASLFPHHAGLKELSPVFAVYDSPKPPPQRLTLSLGAIGSATFNAILVQGAAKGLVAKQAWRGADPALPVSLLPPARCGWYLDDAACAVARS